MSSASLPLLLISLHVIANVVWIGAIASVGWLLIHSKRSSGGEARVLAGAAYALYRRVATPAFGAAFVFGVGQLLTAPGDYMRMHWFHAKLTAAVAVIALHHIIGAKARKASAGSMQPGEMSAILLGALLACAALAVVFVVFKNQLVP